MPDPKKRAKYGLTDADLIKLKRLFDLMESGAIGPPIQRPPFPMPEYIFGGHIGLADASISATTRASTTISSGTVSIWKFTGASSVADTSINVTAYNLSTVAVSTGKWLHLKRHVGSGKWLIDFEAC